MTVAEKPESVEAALEIAKGYYESEMGGLYGTAHAVIETLARELEAKNAENERLRREHDTMRNETRVRMFAELQRFREREENVEAALKLLEQTAKELGVIERWSFVAKVIAAVRDFKVSP